MILMGTALTPPQSHRAAFDMHIIIALHGQTTVSGPLLQRLFAHKSGLQTIELHAFCVGHTR